MRASWWIAVWMVASALGVAAMGGGCSDDDETHGTTTTTTTTTTGEGGTGGTGEGGTGGTGEGGTGGMMGESFDFTMIGTGFTPYADLLVYVTAVAIGESTPLQIGWETVAADGTFTITGQILGGKAYTLGWYADLNENRTCDPAPNDHVWTESLPSVTADITFNVQPNTDYGACQ